MLLFGWHVPLPLHWIHPCPGSRPFKCMLSIRLYDSPLRELPIHLSSRYSKVSTGILTSQRLLKLCQDAIDWRECVSTSKFFNLHMLSKFIGQSTHHNNCTILYCSRSNLVPYFADSSCKWAAAFCSNEKDKIVVSNEYRYNFHQWMFIQC